MLDVKDPAAQGIADAAADAPPQPAYIRAQAIGFSTAARLAGKRDTKSLYYEQFR